MRVPSLSAVLLVLCVAATPKPPTGFSAAGTMDVAVTPPQGNPMSVHVDVHLAHLAQLTRIDVVGIHVTSTDASASMITGMLPKGPLTIVLDAEKRVARVWTTSNHLYYETTFPPKISISVKPTPTPAPSPNANASKHSAGPFKMLTQLDVFSMSVDLDGDRAVNGRAAHVYRFLLKTRARGDTRTMQIDGSSAFADDLDGLPVHADINGNGAGAFHLIGDLTNVTNVAPLGTSFSPPAGYRRTTSLPAVFFSASP